MAQKTTTQLKVDALFFRHGRKE